MNPSKLFRALLPIFCLLSLFAFSQTARAQAAEFSRGVIIERVVCQSNAAQSYALYLPSSYTPEKKWPVIYAFDPVARGRVPVELFQQAAEKYGYIIAGSHNSQNGMQSAPLQAAITSMIADTRQRLSIDEKRIYTTGFSGGARVATRVASSCNGCVAGVVACGAGFPPDITPPPSMPFVYFATIGTEDYNYPELRRLDDKLGALGVSHHVATFDGGHQWAASPLLLEAVEWLELQAMRVGRRERDAAFIEMLWKRGVEHAQQDEAANRLHEAYIGYAALAADFKGLKDVAEYEKKTLALKETKEVRQALKDEQGQLQKQLELAAQLIELGRTLLTEPSARGVTLKEMQAIIDGLRKKAKATEDSSERRVSRRALRQVFAQTFEAAMFNYHPNRQYEIAIANLEVASLIAPDHWQVPYELARAYALKGEKKKAIESLKRAVEKGFPDQSAIENQKDFEAIRAETEYQSIIKSFNEGKQTK